MAHGGQRSTHALLTAVSGIEGADIAAISYTSLDYADHYVPSRSQWRSLGVQCIDRSDGGLLVHCGYPIHFVSGSEDNFEQRLEKLMSDFAPDILLAGQRGAFGTLMLGMQRGLASIWNIDTSPGQGVYEVAELETAYRLGASVICCSEYVRDQIENLTSSNVKAHLVYPPMNRADYSVAKTSDDYITVINPVPAKGGELLETIVGELPGERFLFVDGWELEVHDPYWQRFRERMRAFTNVTIIPRTPDIRTVFSKTKLLLVPSQWDEAFGRVVWEAQCSGIPSIVSAIGGLQEPLGEGGELVVDYQNPIAWVNAIRQIIYSPHRLEQLKAISMKWAERTTFSSEASVRAFMVAARMALETPRQFPRLSRSS